MRVVANSTQLSVICRASRCHAVSVSRQTNRAQSHQEHCTTVVDVPKYLIINIVLSVCTSSYFLFFMEYHDNYCTI